MKRKILSILFILAAFIIFVSCDTENPTPKEGKPSPAPPAPPSITDAEKGQNIPLRFVVMADSRGTNGGINAKVIEKTLESIKQITPAPLFAVMPGDLIDGSNSYPVLKAQLLHFKNTVTKYYPINFFYPGFGNHEASAGISGEKAFEEVFSELKANFLEGYHKTVYYFDKGNSRFYMLNSNHPGEDNIISDTQIDFISVNTDNTKKHNFYFFHMPAYPTGSHVGSSLDVNRFARNKLWEIIDRSQSPLVFCGHEHNYTRRHIDSDFNETVNGYVFKFQKRVYQITTGSFGAPLYSKYIDKKNVDVPPVAEYHFAVVDISESKVKVTVYNLEGRIIDQFDQ